MKLVIKYTPDLFELLDDPGNRRIGAIGINKGGQAVACLFTCDIPDCKECSGGSLEGDIAKVEKWELKE